MEALCSLATTYHKLMLCNPCGDLTMSPCLDVTLHFINTFFASAIPVQGGATSRPCQCCCSQQNRRCCCQQLAAESAATILSQQSVSAPYSSHRHVVRPCTASPGVDSTSAWQSRSMGAFMLPTRQHCHPPPPYLCCQGAMAPWSTARSKRCSSCWPSLLGCETGDVRQQGHVHMCACSQRRSTCADISQAEHAVGFIRGVGLCKI